MQARRSGPANEAELFDVLNGISRSARAMSLVVCDGISERIFRFTPRNLTILRSGPRRSGTIGSVLVTMGRLDPHRLEEILRSCRETGTRFGDCAVSMGLVTREDVQAAIRTKVEEEILDLFFWPGAQFVLFDGEPPASYREGRYHAASHECELSPFLDDLLLRVAERRTFVGRLPTGREVFVLDDFADLSECRGDVADLLGEFDGTQIVTDVIEASHLRRCPAWQAVLSAEQSGVVRRLESSEAKPVVEAAVTREIQSLEALLDRAVDTSVVRIRLARACEEAGQIPRAASHWRHAGDERRTRGDVTGAVESYEHCVRLAPTDFASREKILDIHHTRREFAAVVAQGRPLADLLVQHNLLNRAKRLLLQLVAIEPKNPALRQQLVTVLTGLGEQVLALHHLRELGGMLEACGAPDEQVLDVYLRILAVEPGNAKAKLSIDRLTGVTAQRKATWMTAVATIVGLAACGGAFLYEAAAREQIAFSLDSVERKLASADFAGARLELSAAVSEHPLSFAAWYTRDVVTAIEVLEEDASRTTVRPVADSRTRAQRQREERAEQAKAEIDAHLANGELAQAHRGVGYLLADYRHTAAVRRGEVRAPLDVRVLPEAATISLDGVELGTGSQVITYDPVHSRRILVSLDGFADHEIQVDGLRDDFEAEVWLAPPVEWSHTASGALAATPLVADGVVVVAGRDRRVSGLSLSDGAPLWSAALGFYAEMSASPVRVDAGAVVVTGSGDVVCLDIATGETVWKRALGIPIHAQPLATRGEDGLVVLAATDGRLMAISQRDGATRWDLGPQTVARDTAPTLLDSGRLVYVGALHGLAVARVSDGRSVVRPRRDLGLVTTPAVAFGRVWVAARDRTLRLVSAEDGRSLEALPVPGGAPCAPCLVGDVAFTPAADGSIIAYRVDGAAAFRVTLAEPAGATPVHADGVLYVPGARRRLIAIDSSSGDVLWQLDAGVPIDATPAIAEGLLLVPTSDGRLIALRR